MVTTGARGETPRQYLTRSEVARLFEVSPATVARWTREGKLPFVRTLGGQRRYVREQIIDLMRVLPREPKGGSRPPELRRRGHVPEVTTEESMSIARMPAGRSARVPLDLGRVALPRGQVYVIPHRCKECRFCIDFCPKEVLALSTDANAKGYHYPVVAAGKEEACVHCEFCNLVCPEYAIFTVEVPRAEVAA